MRYLLYLSLIYCIINLSSAWFSKWWCGEDAVIWKGNVQNCKVILPQKDCDQCAKQRAESIASARGWWKWSPGKNLTDDNTLSKELVFPWLNQTVKAIELKSFTDGTKWLLMLQLRMKTIGKLTKYVKEVRYLQRACNTSKAYKRIYHIFRSTHKNFAAPKYFALVSESKTFTDTIDNDLWQEDKYFVQRRLAGTCAYHIQKVTGNQQATYGIQFEKLLTLLNPKFDWDGQIAKVMKQVMSMNEAVEQERLFVLYHEIWNDLPKADDSLDHDSTDTYRVIEKATPITLFILDQNNDLQVVAIQNNYTQDSQVLTPPNDKKNQTETINWLIAKRIVESVDFVVCLARGHDYETHLTQFQFCGIFRRHFSPTHPLYDIMKHHCEAAEVSPLTLKFLFGKLDKMFPVNNTYFHNICYLKQHYNDSDLQIQLSRNGLDDHSQFRYYPYRDDGKKIWNEIKSFASKFVKLYYKRNTDVKYDIELQSFVNEVSANGNAANGPKVKGFPNKFTNIDDLITFLTRFIWLPVKHAANNYPLETSAFYIPLLSTKLYYNLNSKVESIYSSYLPPPSVAMSQLQTMLAASIFRLNRLFDYWNEMKADEAKKLVRMTYITLHTKLQADLELKNLERFNAGDLTYQFMEPKWLTNSIHA